MRKKSGITIISLAITIAVALVLISIVTVSGIGYIKDARNNKYATELFQVQHAVLEQYTMYQETKNEDMYIVGEPITMAEVTEAIQNSEIFLTGDEGEYYLLTPANLVELGIQQADNEYIVNYETGEVINKTHPKDEDRKNFIYKSKIEHII